LNCFNAVSTKKSRDLILALSHYIKGFTHAANNRLGAFKLKHIRLTSVQVNIVGVRHSLFNGFMTLGSTGFLNLTCFGLWPVLVEIS
jgi:hypothetical protein